VAGEPSGPSIREAGAGDEAAISALLDELGYPAGLDEVARRLERLARDAGSWLWLAVDGERVVGLAGLHVMPLIEREPLGRVTAIVVTQVERRGGIGRALMARAEEEARRQGCERLEVTTAERRTDAHAFYRGLGFEEGSRRFLKRL
jgi:N-acetylglutamate synthase-like GNAT family acetyltransferase